MTKQEVIEKIVNGFNPYSTGLSILSIREIEATINLFNGFQSLFYWIINSIAMMRTMIRICNIGFNPYSTGLSILSVSYSFYIRNLYTLFQSLFYWIINSINSSICCLVIFFSLFQSLFYWIINSIYSFVFVCKINYLVSILILLDYQFYRSSIPLLSSLSFTVFQSLFYWIINSIFKRNV